MCLVVYVLSVTLQTLQTWKSRSVFSLSCSVVTGPWKRFYERLWLFGVLSSTLNKYYKICRKHCKVSIPSSSSERVLEISGTLDSRKPALSETRQYTGRDDLLLLLPTHRTSRRCDFWYAPTWASRLPPQNKFRTATLAVQRPPFWTRTIQLREILFYTTER